MSSLGKRGLSGDGISGGGGGNEEARDVHMEAEERDRK